MLRILAPLVLLRAGARYELTAKYADDIYDVVLRSGGRELPRRGLESCVVR